MASYHFQITRDRGSASVLKIDLPDPSTIRAQAEELARILRDEAGRVGHLIDFDVLRVSESSGKVLLAEAIADLANARTRSDVAAKW